MRIIRLESQPTRSLYQPQVIVTSFLILMVFAAGFFTNYYLVNHVNSVQTSKIHDWKQAISKLFGKGDQQTSNIGSEFFNLEMDSPLNSLFNLFFPVDLVLSYNTTYKDEIINHQFLGRYASFSAVLTRPLVTKYSIFPNKACESINGTNWMNFKNRTIIIERGDCTFVDKVKNIVDSGIEPRGIIVANTEPFEGLITMYSNTYNQDASIRIPILFIHYEDYKNLKKLESKDLDLQLTTANLGNWFGILLSMVLSPPLFIILLYTTIVCCQKYRKHQVNARNAKLVKSLPVFIYNVDHLIDVHHFPDYLTITRQSSKRDNLNDLISSSPKGSPSSSRCDLSRIIVNGIDIDSIASSLHILTSPHDFYPSYKCSICLEKYIPLETKVLVLDCKHFYHDKCLSNWLINFRRSCPLCNKTLSSSDNYMFLGQRFSNYGSLDNLNSEDLIGTFNLTNSNDESQQQSVVATNHWIRDTSPSTTSIAYSTPIESGNQHFDTQLSDAHTNSAGVQSTGTISVGGQSAQFHDIVSTQSDTSSIPTTQTCQEYPSSDASYYTATSKELTIPSTDSSNRQIYTKPSQILSRISSTSIKTLKDANHKDRSFDGYSVSIDSNIDLTYDDDLQRTIDSNNSSSDQITIKASGLTSP